MVPLPTYAELISVSLDIGMTRDHYDTFLKVVKDELNDMYYCLEWNSYSDYSIPYAKIKKKNTLFRERKGGSSKYNEVFIDIFPFDNVEGRGIRAAIDALLLYSIRNTLMIKAGMTPWKGEGIASRMKYYPFRMLNLITERESLKRKYDCISRKNNDIETGWIAPRSIDGTEIKQKIKKYIIGNPKQIQFENAYFYCPEHSDAFLTETYGEYRELPPEDKRSPRHEGVEIVL